MKLLNQILNKISSKKFNQVHDSLGALKLIASSLTSDSDILSSFCVLAFDEVPNRNFTTKEYISRKADAKNGLNLVQKHLIAKEVSKLLKDASAFYDSELPSLVKTQADFKRPENVRVFKTAKFGDVALVGNKYHLVNPLTKTVTAEYIVLAADANFAKLHELIAKYRDEKDVKLTELDGQMVLTGAPEVINELEHLIKDIGYYCEAVDESTGVDGEIPEYSLKIFTNTTAAPEFDIEKAAAKHEKVGEDSKFSYWLQLEDNYEDDGYLDSKNVGDHVGFFYATEKGTQAPALLVSQLGFSGDGLTAQRTYPTKSKEPGKTYLYEEYGYTDDDFSEVYNFLNDGLKNVSPEMNKKNLDGLTVDNIDTTNPNLKKDNPMLNTEGVTDEVVEKTSAEKQVEKKAEEKIDFEKELMEAGESKGKKDKVNKEQLEMGKKVEKEHTTNPAIAEKITRDHLAEFPDYYTHLEEMENNAKKNDKVKSSYAPFITIDATTTDEVKVVAGEKVIGTCKTIQAAFEKTADWSSEEVLIDDGTGVTVTYQVYDDESELPVVWAALRHRDNGNVIMCSDATYVGDLLGAEDHIDFLKDIKDFSKEFAKVGLDEEKVQHYQDQTNAKLKEIFQSKPELGAQSSAKPEVKKEADVFNRGVERNIEEFPFDSLDSMLSFLEQHGKTIVNITIMQSSVIPEKYKVIGTFLTDEEIEQLEESNFDKEIESSQKENINKKADEDEISDCSKARVFEYQIIKGSDYDGIFYQVYMNISFDGDYFKRGTRLTIYYPKTDSFRHPNDRYPEENACVDAFAKKFIEENKEKLDTDGEVSIVTESTSKSNINKKADEELKQFDMKQELDGQKEFEKQDDLSQVSVPEEKEDTSEVTETMEAKPEETKGESFSASEFGNNMAYIQQNNPDAFKSIMNNLKQIMVGDQQKIYNFLENWSSHNFQDFTAMTREDPTYARHSQYQEQLKNNVLPKLKEMSEYKQAMEEKVSAEKGNVEASVREYDSSDPEDAAVYNHNGEGEGEED